MSGQPRVVIELSGLGRLVIEGIAFSSPERGAWREPMASEDGVTEALGMWLRDMERREVRDRQKSYRRVVAAMNGGCTRESLEAFLHEKVVGQGASPKTHDNYLSSVRAFMRFAVERELLPEDITEGVQARGNRGRDVRQYGAFEASEVRALMSAACRDQSLKRPRHRAIRAPLYALLYWTGVRIGEACKLKLSDFRHDPPGATVRASTAKNGRQTVIPISPEAWAIIRPYLEERHRDAKTAFLESRPSEKVLRYDMRQAGVPHRDAEGRPRAWHAFRRGLATALARNREPYQLAQRMMRHSDSRLTVDTYVRLQQSELQDVADRLSGGGERKSKESLDSDDGEADVDGVTHTALQHTAGSKPGGSNPPLSALTPQPRPGRLAHETRPDQGTPASERGGVRHNAPSDPARHRGGRGLSTSTAQDASTAQAVTEAIAALERIAMAALRDQGGQE